MNKTTLSFTIVLLILGLFISMQFKTHQDIRNILAYQDPTTLIEIYRILEARETELLENLQELRQQRDYLVSQVTRDEELIYRTKREIEDLQILTGTVPVIGPGITLTFTRDAQIWDRALIHLVNELRVSGAEAIAINDYRLTANTHIQRSLTGDILLNNEPLLFPIVVTAIGNPDDLETGLTMPGGIIFEWRFFGINPTITTRDSVTIPAVNIQETI